MQVKSNSLQDTAAKVPPSAIQPGSDENICILKEHTPAETKSDEIPGQLAP